VHDRILALAVPGSQPSPSVLFLNLETVTLHKVLLTTRGMADIQIRSGDRALGDEGQAVDTTWVAERVEHEK